MTNVGARERDPEYQDDFDLDIRISVAPETTPEDGWTTYTTCMATCTCGPPTFSDTGGLCCH